MKVLRPLAAGHAGSLRRRRARIVAGTAAAVVLACAVALPRWLGGTAPVGRAAGGQQPPAEVTGPVKLVPPPAWTVTLNGRTARMGSAAEPQFGVARGQRVTFVITMTVPAHDQLTKLFLGIFGDSSGIGPRGPIGMKSALATAERLGPGEHAFSVHWTVPLGTEPVYGYQLEMAAYWPRGTKDEPEAEDVPMVTFVARS